MFLSFRVNQSLIHLFIPILNINFKKLQAQRVDLDVPSDTRLLANVTLNTVKLLPPGSQLDQSSRSTEQNACSRSRMLMRVNVECHLDT